MNSMSDIRNLLKQVRRFQENNHPKNHQFPWKNQEFWDNLNSGTPLEQRWQHVETGYDNIPTRFNGFSVPGYEFIGAKRRKPNACVG